MRETLRRLKIDVALFQVGATERLERQGSWLKQLAQRHDWQERRHAEQIKRLEKTVKSLGVWVAVFGGLMTIQYFLIAILWFTK